MSENEKKNRIDNGLPRCIGSGVDGFERLKSLLGLNRDLCRALLKETRALRTKTLRSRQLRPGERDRLQLFELYGDPHIRRFFWKSSYNRGAASDTINRTNSPPFPSLEWSILSKSTPDPFPTEHDAKEIAKAFGDWPDLVQYLEDRDEVPWAGLAARVWSDVRKDLDGWEALEDEKHRQTALAAFAVATIIDDQRILRVAVDKAPELSAEFGDVLNEDAGNSETAAVLPKDNEDDVLSRWGKLCESLRELAVTSAGPPPVVGALDEISEIVEDLKSVAPSVQGHLDKSSFEKLMLHRKELLGEVEADEDFSWLDKSLREQLDARWQKEHQSFSPVQLREEFDRLDEKFPDAVNEVRSIAANLSSAKQQIDSQRAAEPDDYVGLSWKSWEDKLNEFEERRRSLRQQQRQARLILLAVLSPLGEAFDPSPNDTSSPPIPTKPGEDFPISPRPFVDGKQPAESDEESEEPKVLAVTPDSTEPVKQESEHEDGHSEPGDESEASKTHAPLQPSEAEGDAGPDPLAARARVRMAEALLESPPRIAYTVQVGRLLDHMDVSFPQRLPVVLFEAALLSDRLSLPNGNLANSLKQVFERFPPPERFSEGPDRDLFVVVALAAALRPALLAPQSGAWVLLTALKPSERLGAVYRFASGIAEKCKKLQGVTIDSTVLRGASSEAVWDKERRKLCLEAENWLKHARYRTIKFAPANKVWQRWLKQDDLIDRLMRLTISGGSNSDSSIKETLTVLEVRKEFENRVKKTDRNEIGRRRGQDIHAGALNQLHEHAREAAALARRHLSLNSSKPSQSGFLIRALAELRGEIERLAPPALDELQRFASGEKSLFAGLANTAVNAIKRFRELLDPEQIAHDKELAPNELAASGLFGFPSICIDTDGNPEGDPRRTLDALLSGQSESFESAFRQRLNAGDLGTAKRIVDWIEYQQLNDTEALRNSLSEAIHSATQQFRRQIEYTRTRVEGALVHGYIFGEARADYDAILVELERRLTESRMLRFDREKERLNDLVEEIEREFAAHKGKAEADLASLGLSSDSTPYKEISQSISQGDIITANEIISGIREEESLPLSKESVRDQRQVFQEFFPERSLAIEKALEKSAVGGPKYVLEQIDKGSEVAGMPLQNIPDAQRKSARKMLEAWFALKRAGRVDRHTEETIEEKIKVLCLELGFLVQTVSVGRRVTVTRSGRNIGEARLVTDPLRTRELCPIPAFGSSADGKYRLVLLWGRPTEEDILRHVGEHSGDPSTIVLYFGSLSGTTRKALARISRERFRTVLVIDELLLIFLCGEHGSRLSPFFGCVVPFTYVQPYVTTAGLVPPEMFYGREQELREIANPNGPVFIYGGRQLGKTALLREVKRREHQPEKNRYAIWMDLKGRGIGYECRAADIWPAIWRELRSIDAIPEEIREPNNKKRVVNFMHDLRSRFNKSEGRTLLLLLDEADRFLEMDARDPGVATNGYQESLRLKELMENTERSIKVVFAGLHNVQRTAKGSNHPLGHFGTPIQVGPLGWRTAKELVRQPLLASGYQFKQDGLVTRILAQTNYYPSLIQLYGSALIKTMCSKRRAGTPLYEIDEFVLDDTYRERNLREVIGARFRWTLQLDPRYEVIAYAIANECAEQEGLLKRGIERRRIDDAVREWWPEGFEDIEPYTDRFWSLLDEMVGLGVLRTVDQEKVRYTLRNGNVLDLMGTKEEIEDNLLSEREPPQEFEREFFRARHPQKADEPSRSPLTFQQEDLLRAERNGISVVCGLKASGYDDVVPFLKVRGGASVVELGDLAHQQQFEKELHQHYSQRPEGTTIYVVSDSVPWSEKWVQVALDRVGKLRAKGKYVQVVFMTDPNHLWQLFSELEELNRDGLQWISLRPWQQNFLHQWMTEVGFGNDPVIRKQIAERTGRWKLLLERLHGLKQKLGNLNASLDGLEDEFRRENTGQLLNQFGLDDPHAHKALGTLAKLGEAVSLEDLKELVGDDGVDWGTVQKRLEWAELLHLVHREGPSIWKMDAIAARVLTLMGG